MKWNLLKASAFLAIPLVVLSSPLASWANPGQQGNLKMPPEAKHEFKRPGHPASLLEQLRLTPEQKEKIRALQMQGHEQSHALHQQLRAKRQSLMQYLQSPDAEEGKAQGLQAEVSDLQSQMSMQRLKSWFQMRSILTPEQKQRLQQLRPQRPDRPPRNTVAPPPPPPPPGPEPDRD